MQHLIFGFLLLFANLTAMHASCDAPPKPPHISSKVWKKVSPHLLPEDHPFKPKLDRIFSASRAIFNSKTMEEAGFENGKVREFSKIVVTTHPKIPGCVIKAHLDVQRYHSNHPEYYYWLLRIKGASLIKEYLDEQKWNHLFKVPKKWIYTLPENPAPPHGYLQKNFILVEEDMSLYNSQANKDIWKSSYVTQELLEQLYAILEKIGLHDCAKTHNIPFSTDGRIAFIDTQSFYDWPVAYDCMTDYLPSDLQEFWVDLTDCDE